jgi:hypothetical protein
LYAGCAAIIAGLAIVRAKIALLVELFAHRIAFSLINTHRELKPAALGSTPVGSKRGRAMSCNDTSDAAQTKIALKIALQAATLKISEKAIDCHLMMASLDRFQAILRHEAIGADCFSRGRSRAFWLARLRR